MRLGQSDERSGRLKLVCYLAQFIGTGLVVALGSAWFLRGLPDLAAIEAMPGVAPGRLVLTAAVLGLVAMGFAAVIAEGGTSDWSALYLREISHASPGVAAAGFSGFSIAAMLYERTMRATPRRRSI